MIQVQSFAFNPFSENTYILHDESKECVIIDAGCYMPEEKQEVKNYIQSNGLNPVRLLNTHCHIDHVLGNRFIADTYKLKPEMHEKDLPMLHALKQVSTTYGIPADPAPEPGKFLTEKDTIQFGNSEMRILFAPGHSPGSIVFYSEADHFIISGDVLFYQSIGRYDFPGGDYDTLMHSIREVLFALPDNTKVYSGHGQTTTIGFEKKHNPFLVD